MVPDETKSSGRPEDKRLSAEDGHGLTHQSLVLVVNWSIKPVMEKIEIENILDGWMNQLLDEWLDERLCLVSVLLLLWFWVLVGCSGSSRLQLLWVVMVSGPELVLLTTSPSAPSAPSSSNCIFCAVEARGAPGGSPHSAPAGRLLSLHRFNESINK